MANCNWPRIDSGARLTAEDLDRACTGNCNQGRACDCEPDIDEDEPMTAGGAVELIAAALAAWVLVALVVVLGWHVAPMVARALGF